MAIKFFKLVLVFCTFLFCYSMPVIAQDVVSELELTSEEKTWITEHPVLRASNQLNWAPLDFVENGKAYGFSVDYLDLIAKKIGIKIEYVSGYSWAELVDQLQDREIDIAQSISYNEARHEFLDFTSPYLDLRKVFFGRSGEEQINSISDLMGKRIGVIGIWAKSESIKDKFPNLEFVEFANPQDAMNALTQEEIDVFSIRQTIGNYIIAQNLLYGIKVLGPDLFTQVGSSSLIRLASRNDWPILNSILEKGMSAVSDVEFKAISRKWRYEYYSNNHLNLTPEELDWLSKNKTVRVAVGPEGAPIEFIGQNGEISGIAGAYLSEISSKLGVTFEWIGNESWKDGFDSLLLGDADIISVVTPTPERVKHLSFIESYLNVAHMIFSREGGKVYGNMDGLKGHKVVQVTGNAVTGYVKRDYPELDVVEVSSSNQALKLLSTGKVDAYIATIPIASQKIAEEGLTQIIVTGETPYRGEYTIGVRSDLAILSSVMQKAMQSITPVKRAEISQKWLVSKINNRVDYDLIWKIIGFSLICGVMILIRTYSLGREVKRREIVEKKLLHANKKAELAQSEAEAANIAKSTFLANMSHEIRTPLNAIIGFSDIMLSGIHGEIKEAKYQEYLQDIKGSGEHLATVIKDILDLSKIEAGKWHLEEEAFSLFECTVEAAKMLEPQATQKNVSLSYDKGRTIQPLKLIGDVHAIKRSLINLLSNAVKFTGESGSVRCQTKRSDDGGVTIEIVDTGIGIPSDRLEHVLNPFEQCEQTHELNEEGTGLGLPIVKKLVELHDGVFTLISEVGIGTRAIIAIPPHRVFTD